MRYPDGAMTISFPDGSSKKITPGGEEEVILDYIVLCCIVLYCTVLYCTVLYCIILKLLYLTLGVVSKKKNDKIKTLAE